MVMLPEVKPFINQVFCADSAEKLKEFPSDCIDLVVTSPPYDALRTYNGFQFDFCGIAKELARVLAPGGVIVWVVGDAVVDGSESLTSFKQAIFFKQNCGLNLHDTMIWEKAFLKYPDAIRYYQAFEYMFVFSKGTPKTFNPISDRKNAYVGDKVHGTQRERDGERRPRAGAGKRIVPEYSRRFNVWKFHHGIHKEEILNGTVDHPAVFPSELARDHILSWSNPLDVVLDPFAGSGTTLREAKANNRYFCGIDTSPEYVQDIKRRLHNVGIMNEAANI